MLAKIGCYLLLVLAERQALLHLPVLVDFWLDYTMLTSHNGRGCLPATSKPPQAGALHLREEFCTWGTLFLFYVCFAMNTDYDTISGSHFMSYPHFVFF